MEDVKENIKTYELGYLLPHPEAEAEVMAVLRRQGASVVNQGKLADVKLAYPIKKHQVAYFGFIQFQALPADADKIKTAMVLQKEVLRSILLVAKAAPVGNKIEFAPAAPRTDKPASTRPVLGGVPASKPQILSNEALSEKLEEILK